MVNGHGPQRSMVKYYCSSTCAFSQIDDAVEDDYQTRGHPIKNAALEWDKGKLVRDDVLIVICRFCMLLKGKRKNVVTAQSNSKVNASST